MKSLKIHPKKILNISIYHLLLLHLDALNLTLFELMQQIRELEVAAAGFCHHAQRTQADQNRILQLYREICQAQDLIPGDEELDSMTERQRDLTLFPQEEPTLYHQLRIFLMMVAAITPGVCQAFDLLAIDEVSFGHNLLDLVHFRQVRHPSSAQKHPPQQDDRGHTGRCRQFWPSSGESEPHAPRLDCQSCDS